MSPSGLCGVLNRVALSLPSTGLTQPGLNPKALRGQGPTKDPSTHPAPPCSIAGTPSPGPLRDCSPLHPSPYVHKSLSPSPPRPEKRLALPWGKVLPRAGWSRDHRGLCHLRARPQTPTGMGAPGASITPPAVPAHAVPVAARPLPAGHEPVKTPGPPLRPAARGRDGESSTAQTGGVVFKPHQERNKRHL